MDRRIHDVLDGVRSADELAPAERRRLAAYRRVIDAEIEALAVEPVPDLTSAVSARITALEADGGGSDGDPSPAKESTTLGRAIRWFWRPRRLEVSLRPAHGVLAAAGVAGLLMLGLPGDPPPRSASSAPSASRVLVHFRLDAVDATSVHVAGDFTDWEPTVEMRQVAPGVWSVVVPMEPGVHDYGFVVDGSQWRTDPAAPQVADGFGGTNSRLALLPPQTEERS